MRWMDSERRESRAKALKKHGGGVGNVVDAVQLAYDNESTSEEQSQLHSCSPAQVGETVSGMTRRCCHTTTLTSSHLPAHLVAFLLPSVPPLVIVADVICCCRRRCCYLCLFAYPSTRWIGRNLVMLLPLFASLAGLDRC